MEIAIKVIQFLLSLSILIAIHELGHYLAARYFNIRVEKFYLFFNPWFSLFKKKIGETEYGIGWLPLGGYVKISGMIDESMDKEQMKQEPKPWEFRTKPAWQRLIVMLGGVTFNVLLAILIYIFMLSITGERYLPAKNVTYGIMAGPLAQDLGMKTGDKILYINGEEVEDFTDILRDFVMGNAKTVSVKRNEEIITLDIPEDFFARIISERGANFMSLRFPFIAAGFVDGSPAKDAGVQEGDQIIGINETETWSFDEFHSHIGNFAGQQINLQVLRDGEKLSIPMKVTDEGFIGVYLKPLQEIFEYETRDYSFFAAIPAGTVKAWNTTINYLGELRLLFRPEVKASESLGGFITIGSIFAPTWDWEHFWTITAFLSIILAIMNILPIPALDGGHVMFLFYEIIVGRKPSDKFMEYAQTIGMLLLLSLIIFANYNDIMRLIR
ncbi:MAG: RIP metalloprotease RseP [Bacteroidetes bacterium]|nr:MAG: RIP metalloprotease RseP [Bacteroidota bacterium]